jgi:protein involved in polysaccharide export with SLBB domain
MKAKQRIIYFILAAGLLLTLTSCATSQPAVTPAEVQVKAAAPKPVPYVIHAGDQLDIKFFFNPELNESVVVRPDGKISLQLIDEIQASGLQPSELDQKLTDLYSKELRKPVLTVIVRSFSGQRVYVGGEVNRQGLITLQPGLTVLQAVFQSGGFMETAQPAETLIIRKGPDNKPVPLRIDLAEVIAASDPNADFQLQPDDIVFVPKSAIAKANKFVRQYVEELFLFRGVSLGFSYELHSDSND